MCGVPFCLVIPSSGVFGTRTTKKKEKGKRKYVSEILEIDAILFYFSFQPWNKILLQRGSWPSCLMFLPFYTLYIRWWCSTAYVQIHFWQLHSKLGLDWDCTGCTVQSVILGSRILWCYLHYMYLRCLHISATHHESSMHIWLRSTFSIRILQVPAPPLQRRWASWSTPADGRILFLASHRPQAGHGLCYQRRAASRESSYLSYISLHTPPTNPTIPPLIPIFFLEKSLNTCASLYCNSSTFSTPPTGISSYLFLLHP